MDDVLQAFQEGGWPMYVVLLCTMATHPLAVGIAITAFVSKRKGMVIGLAAASLVFGLSTACAGAGGYLWSMQQVNEAVAYADPAFVETLRAQGQREASWNWICGAIGAALPALLSLIALVRGITMRGDERPSARG